MLAPSTMRWPMLVVTAARSLLARSIMERGHCSLFGERGGTGRLGDMDLENGKGSRTGRLGLCSSQVSQEHDLFDLLCGVGLEFD
jgi:hypothetical protein